MGAKREKRRNKRDLPPSSVSAARLNGLEADLKLVGSDYPTVLSIIYVGYIIMQVCAPLSPPQMAAPDQVSQIPSNMYVTRTAFPPPSPAPNSVSRINRLIQYTGRPSIYLPCCMIIWGTISCLTGVTKNLCGRRLGAESHAR